jgi:superfamily II DNA/RNA helicase
MVINFDVPPDAEDYVHRIGRTARAQSDGIAYTFINQRDQRRFLQIEELIERVIEKKEVPKDFGETPNYEPKKRHGGNVFKGNRKNKYRGKNSKNKGKFRSSKNKS